MKSNNFKFVEDSNDIGTTQVKNKSIPIKPNNFKVIEDPKEDGTTVLKESVLDDSPKGADTGLKTENPVLIMLSGLNDFYGADGIYILRNLKRLAYLHLLKTQSLKLNFQSMYQ